MKKISLVLIATFLWFAGFTQLHKHEEHHEHSHYHIESEIGIGVASALVYDIGEKEFAPGFHLHALKIFNEKIGAGIGYEAILGDNYHQTITAFGKIIIADFLSINVGPGITFPNKEHNEYSLTGHLEIATAFDLWDLHLGPLLGYGIGAEDSHVSLGLHLGWHF